MANISTKILYHLIVINK